MPYKYNSAIKLSGCTITKLEIYVLKNKSPKKIALETNTINMKSVYQKLHFLIGKKLLLNELYIRINIPVTYVHSSR